MVQMLELIKKNAVPAAMMRSAAKGALSVPASEMIEILVYLTNNPVFGHEARMTLTTWDATSTLALISAHPAPQEVLDYFWNENNRRPRLMPTLIEHPQISEDALAQAAPGASREMLTMMLASARVHANPAVLAALLENPRLVPNEIQQLRQELGTETTEEPEEHDPAVVSAHDEWTKDHQAEISAEEGKAFELTDPEDHPAPPPAAPPSAAMAATALASKHVETLEEKRYSVFVKISRMNVSSRVKLAFLGNKEERSILIRDGAKIVQNAVLSSPKLTESEVEVFAALKNVQENVLREIARNRRYIKAYSVVRNLVTNPKCPLDVSLALVKHLMVADLKNLQSNKNVPDTLRQIAFKMFREKTDNKH